MLGQCGLVLFIVILGALEVHHRLYRLSAKTPFAEPTYRFSLDEFEKQAHKRGLVILDNLVLEVKDYMQDHPGGKFMLEHCVGGDITKYFHGGYALENTGGPLPHRHSEIPRRIVNSLIVGKLEGSVSMTPA